MSTQINNSAPSQSITPTYESLHWVYASTKSPTGYVVSSKRLPNKDAVWTCPSNDLALMWISHQVLMHQRQAAIDGGMTKAQAVAALKAQPIGAAVLLDTTTTSSYDVETTKTEDNNMNAEQINAMTLQDLASLQLRIANRINYLVTQQALQQTNEPELQQDSGDTTKQEQLEEVQPEVVAAPSVEAQASEPLKAPEVKTKRKFKSKKASNVEAVEQKIEATLCVMSRDEAKAYIKLNKLPIKTNMKCEDMNDAINAHNQGGIEAVPTQYLTKAAATKLSGFAKKEAAPVAKKTVVKSRSSKAK